MLIPTYTTPVPSFDLLNELNNVITTNQNQIQEFTDQKNLVVADIQAKIDAINSLGDNND